MSRREVCRRGTVAVAAIVVLVVVQLVIVGMVVAGARDQDLTVQRLSTVRAMYTAEGVANLAIREMIRGVDEDGDGAIGSIAGGVVASGPTVNGARAAASLLATGETSTIVVKGVSGFCTRAISLEVRAGTAAVDPVAVYAASAAPSAPAVRQYSMSAWGSPVTTGALGAAVAWQALKTSPVNTGSPARALVSLASDRSLSLTLYGSGAWGSPSTLAADAGVSTAPVYAAEYEGQSGNLMVAYRKGTSTSIFYRWHAAPSPSEQFYSAGLAAAPTWMEMVSKPNSNELLLLARAGSCLHAVVWNGASWGSASTLETSLPASGRPFHGAYMNASGSAIVVWTATTGAPKYATWNGASWSSAASVPGIAGGVPAGWIELAGSPLGSSDGVLMACIGTNNQVNLNSWDGAAWKSNLVAETSAAAHHEPRVDVAYQNDGVTGLAVWHRSGQDSLRYRTWNGSAWSSQQTGPNMASETCTIRLARGYESGDVMMLARRKGASSFSDYMIFSSVADYDFGNNVTINGPISASGGSLPAPPAGASGSPNLNPADNATVAPGAYGTLSIANNRTVNFTSGTYVVVSWTIGNNATFNFDTSGGPITFIVKNGNVSGSNNCAFVNTGSSAVQVHVVNGNFQMNNNTTFANIGFIVYNGNIQIKNNSSGSVGLYAKGSVEIGNNGTLNPNGIGGGGSGGGVASAVLWKNGVPGARVDLCASMAAAGSGDPCSLAGNPMPSPPRVSSWAAVEPTP